MTPNSDDNDHQPLFYDFINQPVTGISEFDFVSVLKIEFKLISLQA